MTDTPPQTTRPKRGAPAGNKNAAQHGAPRGNSNAAKHGFYSHWFTQLEHKRLDEDSLGQLSDEEKSLTIIIDRIFAAMKDEQDMNFDKVLAAARAVSLMVGRIESIQRSRKAIYDNVTTVGEAMDECKRLPIAED